MFYWFRILPIIYARNILNTYILSFFHNISISTMLTPENEVMCNINIKINKYEKVTR